MSGATPGPWAISELHANGLFGNNGEAFVSTADYRVAAVDCHAKFKRGEGYRAKCGERDANARLIASAPDLLAALESICDRVSSETIERGREVIKRATGAA